MSGPTCILSCSVHHNAQQNTWIVKAAAVKVDSRRTAHEQIVFLTNGEKKKKGHSTYKKSIHIIKQSSHEHQTNTPVPMSKWKKNKTNLQDSCNFSASLIRLVFVPIADFINCILNCRAQAVDVPLIRTRQQSKLHQQPS